MKPREDLESTFSGQWICARRRYNTTLSDAKEQARRRLAKMLGRRTLMEQALRKRFSPSEKPHLGLRFYSWRRSGRVFFYLATETLEKLFKQDSAGLWMQEILYTVSASGYVRAVYYLLQLGTSSKMHLPSFFFLSFFVTNVFAATSTTTSETTSITGCNTHGTDIFCHDEDGHEVLVSATATPTSGVPAQYTGCHSHGSETYCIDSDGNEALIQEEDTAHDHEGETEESGHNHSHEESEGEGKTNCHFHAGVEHCVGEGESEESSHQSCGIQSRDYDVALRIGTLFVVLVTSSIGVFAPILLAKLPFKAVNAVVSTIIKQFGTGIIIATAFVHLYTHATLMFTNECLGELDYEATTSAVVMAGTFLAFVSEYVGHRFIVARESITPTSDSQETSRKDTFPSDMPQPQTTLAHFGHSHGSSGDSTKPSTKFSVLVMEAGILFHSILIGLTLVVSGDSFYKTLLVVIVFHQFFEGLALGARIATLPGAIFPSKALMASAFALITPIGMAIGLGVLHSFNGNEKNTLIALGTLDALSAGILVWVGVVDMWARDWVIEGGEMLNATWGKVMTGGLSLVAGLVLMGLLGKWA